MSEVNLSVYGTKSAFYVAELCCLQRPMRYVVLVWLHTISGPKANVVRSGGEAEGAERLEVWRQVCLAARWVSVLEVGDRAARTAYDEAARIISL